MDPFELNLSKEEELLIGYILSARGVFLPNFNSFYVAQTLAELFPELVAKYCFPEKIKEDIPVGICRRCGAVHQNSILNKTLMSACGACPKERTPNYSLELIYNLTEKGQKAFWSYLLRKEK